MSSLAVVRRILPAALVALVPAGPAAAAPSGRVVRIERDAASEAPRLCEIHGDDGTCVGDEPRAGQTVVVLDEQTSIAEARVVSATPMSKCASLWTVKLRHVRGDGARDGVGVIDAALDPARAHVLDKDHLPASPSGKLGDEVWRAIDRDGDGTADIVFTHYMCDATGAVASTSTDYCLDVWSRQRSGMVRTSELNFARCKL